VNEADKWKWESELVYSSDIHQIYIYHDSSDESENEDDLEVIATPMRSIRAGQAPSRFICQVIHDNAVNEEGDLVHFELLLDSEPINYKEAMKIDVWKSAMVDEV